MQPRDGRARVVIEGIEPHVDGGRYPVKRVAGEPLVVEADVFTDGHDAVACALLHRGPGQTEWTRVPMAPLGNDRWVASFTAAAIGRHVYTVQGWIDRLATWRRDLARRVQGGQGEEDLRVELQRGVEIIRGHVLRAPCGQAGPLEEWAAALADEARPVAERLPLALDEARARLAERHPDIGFPTTYEPLLPLEVDRPLARFSAWYELFPRSTSPDPGRHGTLADLLARLDYVAGMGFDIVYLPPIHPIGVTARKGPNNAPVAGPGDPGSPWAIGAAEGGHDAIHPALGTLEDFDRLVARARELGLEVALDIAFQASPDHPWVRERPDWFRHRPDGSIQYAENPPKKYQDVYPFDFEGEGWEALWAGLEGVFRAWIARGVTVFRVDNPHTKPFPFWEAVIGRLKRDHPGLIFLSEAFTRPRVMYRLAKLGFSQSYTYFTWRNTKESLTEYFTELTRTRVREFFRPCLWPNTPDILHEYLQTTGRAGSAVRLALAATLGASYGVYGPAFELVDVRPREPGSEEYLDSEKYQVRSWDLDQPHSLRDLLAKLNRLRRENPALQSDRNLRFHPTDNQELLCYSKHSDDMANVIVVVVNLDPHHAQSGWVELALEGLGVAREHTTQVHDLLAEERFIWHGERHFVKLDPARAPAHVFRLRRRVRTERDFDYFL